MPKTTGKATKTAKQETTEQPKRNMDIPEIFSESNVVKEKSVKISNLVSQDDTAIPEQADQVKQAEEVVRAEKTKVPQKKKAVKLTRIKLPVAEIKERTVIQLHAFIRLAMANRDTTPDEKIALANLLDQYAIIELRKQLIELLGI